MEIQTELNLKKITNSFIYISNTIELENYRGLTNLNKQMENFLIFIFNIYFNANFINSNKSNYPAIDLYDLENRIAIQITSIDRMDKKRHTYNLFRKMKLYHKFDELHIFILKYGGNLSKKGLPNHPDTSIYILDFKRLCKDLPILCDEKIQKILDYIEKELIIDSDILNNKFLLPEIIKIEKETILGFIYNSGQFLGGEDENKDIDEAVETYNSLFNIVNKLSTGAKNLLLFIISRSINEQTKKIHLNTLVDGIYIKYATLENHFNEDYSNYVEEMIEAKIAHKNTQSIWVLGSEYKNCLSIYYRGEMVDGNAFAFLYDYLGYCPKRLRKVLIDNDYSTLN